MGEAGWPESHSPGFPDRHFTPHHQIHLAAPKGHVHPMNQRPTALQKAIDSRRLSQARNQKQKVQLPYEQRARRARALT